MLQIRRRWSALAAALAVGAYILNNYRLEGLEQLKLIPRSPGEIAARQAAGDAWSTDSLHAWDNLKSFGDASVQPRHANLPPKATQPREPTTSPQNIALPPPPSAGEADLGRLLSIGEKLAIWEDKRAQTTSSPVANSFTNTLRVASFHVPSLGSTKLAKPHVFEMLVRVLRKFDVVALQGIQSSRDDILPLIVERLNQSGRTYDYMIGPRVGRTAPLEQFAFVFDTQRLETDRFQLYTIDDPEDLITREPLVAWFRVKGVATQQAFTFSLINVAIEPALADRERAILPNLISAIEHDGRGEDDWILLGDFAGGDAELHSLARSGSRLALVGVPTTTDGSRMLDDIIFPGAATVEFAGKAGAFDFLRQFNLSLEQALEVSDHLPIWAEFSALEGAEPGHIAPVN